MTITITRVDARDFRGERITEEAAEAFMELSALHEMAQMAIGKCFLEALSLGVLEEPMTEAEGYTVTFRVEERHLEEPVLLDDRESLTDGVIQSTYHTFPTPAEALAYMHARAKELLDDMLAADPEQIP